MRAIMFERGVSCVTRFLETLSLKLLHYDGKFSECFFVLGF